MSSGVRMGVMPSCGTMGPEGLPLSCHCEGFAPRSHERRPAADTTHSGGWRPTTSESQAAVLRQRCVEKALCPCVGSVGRAREDDTLGIFRVSPKGEGRFISHHLRLPLKNPGHWNVLFLIGTLTQWQTQPCFHRNLFPSRPGHPARRLLLGSCRVWLCD